MQQKGSAQIFVTIFLILGIGIGVFLTQRATTYFSKAYEEGITLNDFLESMGAKKNSTKYDQRLDYNHDGVINVIDVLNGRLKTPSPSTDQNTDPSPSPEATTPTPEPSLTPTPSPTTINGKILGDLDNNGHITSDDYNLLSDLISDEKYEALADMNNDKVLNDADLDIVFEKIED